MVQVAILVRAVDVSQNQKKVNSFGNCIFHVYGVQTPLNRLLPFLAYRIISPRNRLLQQLDGACQYGKATTLSMINPQI
jgi:hypothetical protein